MDICMNYCHHEHKMKNNIGAIWDIATDVVRLCIDIIWAT